MLGSVMQLSGPLSSEQNMSAYYEGLQNVKAPVWDVTLLEGSSCNGKNALNESQITSAGTTTFSCQALPTKFAVASVSVEQGFCMDMYYSSDCTGGMKPFCNIPGVSCASVNLVNNRNAQLFGSFDIVPN